MPTIGFSANLDHLRPEQQRLYKANRLKAKLRIQQQAQAQNRRNLFAKPQQGASGEEGSRDVGEEALGKGLNPNGERPSGPLRLEQPKVTIGPNANLRDIPSTSRNANLPSDKTKAVTTRGANLFRSNSGGEAPPLQRDKALGDYIEFDLSKLHNSKGGFLVDEEDGQGGGGAKSLLELKMEKERELQRLKSNFEPGISLDKSTRPECEKCSSPEIVHDPFLRVFGRKVCKSCERSHPELYSLLTKTEVKEDYLLTDAELKDEEILPHLLKANPHKSTYSNMMLYLRCQVEEYAFSESKWGSEQGLDDEFERREEEKSRKRGKKFQKALFELRRRTRDNVWQKRKDQEHVHTFQEVVDGGGRGIGVSRCTECGYQVEVEVF
ncbi:DNA repair protein [Violaceomyces palustris]|uniref:DNA repair protein n=1 Tax=Violaceomyces palustris TaxID=1673888 RepID=A0ACD0NN98_9BASI|nr:DNA repair protein [Violaceomyces palustris]